MTSSLAGMILASLDENAFEEWLLTYLKGVFHPSAAPRRYGRRGQVQQGVDIFFQSASSEWIGVQAKAYRKTRLTTKLIDDELKLAEQFTPPLARYIICTLNDRDSAIQEHARGLRLHGKCTVEVLALQDLAEGAVQDQESLRDLWQRMGVPHMEAVKTIAASFGPAVVPSGADGEGDGTHDAVLKDIEDWIDEGYPDRALAELAHHQKATNATEWMRVRLRAQFAQGQLGLVIDEVRRQSAKPNPDPIILAYGAHAAQLDDQPAVADEWLGLALDAANPSTRARVVGTYIRVHAERGDSNSEDLETFAGEQLGSGLPVALAIADAAFMLGDFERALRWYKDARSRQAHWATSAEGNVLSATIWQQIESLDAGKGDKLVLGACVNDLKSLVDKLGPSKMRLPLLVNLGFAYRTLRDVSAAAAAWDEVLDHDERAADLWVRRCILSAVEGATLPTEEQEARWAVTPRARLALASACVLQQKWSRAEPLIEAVVTDPSASRQERILAEIERIGLETKGRPDQVSGDHVTRLLAFVDEADPSPGLFIWLVEHHRLARTDDAHAVRVAILAMAGKLEPAPQPLLAMTESVVKAGLDDVAAAWLPKIEGVALSAGGTISSLPGALLLLRISARTFRFGSVRDLVGKLHPTCLTDANVAVHCAKALEDIGDHVAMHALLTQLITQGQHHVSVLLVWARNAVRVGKRRAAHRLVRQLSVELRHTHDYAQFLQLRGLLGVHGDEGVDFGDNTRVTAATAGAIFGAGILTRSRRQMRVAFNRIVHVRISRGAVVVMDERILLVDESSLMVDGVRTLRNSEYPWISDLLGAGVGDFCNLTHEPFVGDVAEIVDVWDAVRWAHSRAAEMLHMLPQTTTGVHAFSGELDALREQVTAQVAHAEDTRRRVASSARRTGASISMVVAGLAVSPRALLQAQASWAPTGPVGTKESIAADDAVLATQPRLVLDPITVMLLVDLEADDLIARLPARPAMTPQGVTQLFDWWYRFERQQVGTQGHMVRASDGQAVIVPVSAAGRLEIAAFWRRVRALIRDHVDIVEPDGLTNPELLKITHALGAPIISGIALAEQRGWVYVSEEGMIASAARGLGRAKAASLHRLATHGVDSGWWELARGFAIIAGLIKRGWSWVGFPIPWLEYALSHPGWAPWEMVSALLFRLRNASPPEGLTAIFRLLLLLDRGQFRGRSQRSLRLAMLAAMPRLAASHRGAIAREFLTNVGDAIHPSSKGAILAWVQDEERFGPLSAEPEDEE